MKFGADGEQLAKAGLDALAQAFGTEAEPSAIETAIANAQSAGPGVAEAKVNVAEASMAAQMLAFAEMQKQGNEQQRMTNELLMAQAKTPGWRSDWLYYWQYFLLAAWAWTIFIVHILNAAIRLTSGASAAAAVSLPAPDLGVLVTLTGLYLGLHMGGHTVLELVRGGMFQKPSQPEAK